MRHRRSASLGAVAIAVLALAACGTAHEAPRPASTHAAASTEGPAGSLPSGGSTDTALATKLERALSAGRSAHVLMDLGDAGTGTGEVDFDGSSPSMDITLTGAQTGTSEMRLIDGALYVTSSIAGKGWIRLGTGAGSLDPTSFLEQVKGLHGGTDLGNGHWRVSEGNGGVADIYFDGDGMVHKTVVKGAGGTPITITYSDWGTKVAVHAPPLDQVTDMSHMAPTEGSAASSPAP